MLKHAIPIAIAAFGATASGAATLNGSTGYGLAGGGNQLVVFGDLSMPGSSSTVTLNGPSLSALAYRPVTGELYGYANGKGANPDEVYVIDTATGTMTSTGAAFDANANIGNTARVGFDFNNAIDAARAVSTDADNLVFFPNDFSAVARQNTVSRFTDLFYATGDANAGVNPMIFANAYTNAVAGRVSGAGTLQYALDAGTNSLVTLDNNNGTLATLAAITFNGSILDFNDRGGFEILSEIEGDNLALALLNVTGGPANGTSGLYTIDLGTGAATFAGDPGRSDFIEFAASGAPAPVPLPASVLLLAAGIGGLGALRRFRKS